MGFCVKSMMQNDVVELCRGVWESTEHKSIDAGVLTSSRAYTTTGVCGSGVKRRRKGASLAHSLVILR